MVKFWCSVAFVLILSNTVFSGEEEDLLNAVFDHFHDTWSTELIGTENKLTHLPKNLKAKDTANSAFDKRTLSTFDNDSITIYFKLNCEAILGTKVDILKSLLVKWRNSGTDNKLKEHMKELKTRVMKGAAVVCSGPQKSKKRCNVEHSFALSLLSSSLDQPVIDTSATSSLSPNVQPASPASVTNITPAPGTVNFRRCFSEPLKKPVESPTSPTPRRGSQAQDLPLRSGTSRQNPYTAYTDNIKKSSTPSLDQAKENASDKTLTQGSLWKNTLKPPRVLAADVGQRQNKVDTSNGVVPAKDDQHTTNNEAQPAAVDPAPPSSAPSTNIANSPVTSRLSELGVLHTGIADTVALLENDSTSPAEVNSTNDSTTSPSPKPYELTQPTKTYEKGDLNSGAKIFLLPSSTTPNVSDTKGPSLTVPENSQTAKNHKMETAKTLQQIKKDEHKNLLLAAYNCIKTLTNQGSNGVLPGDPTLLPDQWRANSFAKMEFSKWNGRKPELVNKNVGYTVIAVELQDLTEVKKNPSRLPATANTLELYTSQLQKLIIAEFGTKKKLTRGRRISGFEIDHALIDRRVNLNELDRGRLEGCDLKDIPGKNYRLFLIVVILTDMVPGHTMTAPKYDVPDFEPNDEKSPIGNGIKQR